MSDEIYWLTLYAVFTSFLFIPYAIARVLKSGFAQSLINPVLGDDPLKQAWAHRAYRAHMNAIENIVIFAPLAIAVHVTGAGNETTAMAAATFFWARVAHVPLAIMSPSVFRSAAWFVGWASCLVLAYQLVM